MAAPLQSAIEPSAEETPLLAGERIVFVGKLAGMSRREASELVLAQGATVVSDESHAATIVVLGDGQPDLATALQNDTSAPRRIAVDVAEGRATLLREAELWQRLGLVDQRQGVQRHYTPAMLADLLNVPVAAIRRWHRGGILVACRNVRRLPYFDFSEVAVARHLATLLQAGCSLRMIDRRLNELKKVMPDSPRPLADPAVVVSGRQLVLRRGDDLAEPSGQLLIDFDKPDDATDDQQLVLQVHGGVGFDSASGDADREAVTTPSTLEQLQQSAQEWEDLGELARAAEAYRTMLVAGGPSAEIQFSLADLLYRQGDLSAARERFYAAIELDEEYVEARANLGCVLAENNELELAVAAFQGALAYHPEYADVHYHLANSLDRLSQPAEAEMHWKTFLALTPESPWAEMARSRLEKPESCPR